MSDDTRIQSSEPLKQPNHQDEKSSQDETCVKRRTPFWTRIKIISGWAVVVLLALNGMALLRVAVGGVVPPWKLILAFLGWAVVLVAVVQAVFSAGWTTTVWNASPLWKKTLVFVGWAVVLSIVVVVTVGCVAALFLDLRRLFVESS